MRTVGKRRSVASLAEYSVLLARVRETFVFGQQKVEELKLHTYWEAGRLLHEHLRHHENEAAYGKRLMPKLARELGLGDELLYRMLRFYRAYPISSTWRKLTWSHFRTLARVPDQKRRRQLEALAERGGWSSARLEKQVSFLTNGATRLERRSSDGELSVPAIHLLAPKRGKTGIYRLVSDGDSLAVDLGFTSFQPVEDRHSSTLESGSLVALTSGGDARLVPEATAADLYTYAAEVLRVVDGDTLVLKIWLTARLWLKEKVRLRGLDAPELDTAEGKAAKRFIEKLVGEAVSITVTTTKPDKWDRYLSDVFLAMPDGEELFLNNALLEHGHARRYDHLKPSDWEM